MTSNRNAKLNLRRNIRDDNVYLEVIPIRVVAKIIEEGDQWERKS